MPRGKQTNIFHYQLIQTNEDNEIIKNKYYKTRSDILSDNNITYNGISERLLCNRKNARKYLDIKIIKCNIPIYKKILIDENIISYL